MDKSNYGSKFEVKGQRSKVKDKVTENENVNIVFHAHLRQQYIDLVQPRLS